MDCTKLTPPALARRWGVTPEKVLDLIRSGELGAIDISGGKLRSRYLIDESDIAEFERRRATRPLPVVQTGRPCSQVGVTKEYV